MAEYIEREAVLSAITVDGFEHFSGCLSSSEVSLIEMLRDTVSEIPAADVEVVKHGRWVFDGQDHFCDRCNRNALCDKMTGEEVLSVVCPNCGAKMDLEVTNGQV